MCVYILVFKEYRKCKLQPKCFRTFLTVRTRAAVTLLVLRGKQLILVFYYWKLSVESCAGAAVSESVLKQNLTEPYTGLRAESTAHACGRVYNNTHTITNQALLHGQRGRRAWTRSLGVCQTEAVECRLCFHRQTRLYGSTFLPEFSETY